MAALLPLQDIQIQQVRMQSQSLPETMPAYEQEKAPITGLSYLRLVMRLKRNVLYGQLIMVTGKEGYVPVNHRRKFNAPQVTRQHTNSHKSNLHLGQIGLNALSAR